MIGDIYNTRQFKVERLQIQSDLNPIEHLFKIQDDMESEDLRCGLTQI